MTQRPVSNGDAHIFDITFAYNALPRELHVVGKENPNRFHGGDGLLLREATGLQVAHQSVGVEVMEVRRGNEMRRFLGAFSSGRLDFQYAVHRTRFYWSRLRVRCIWRRCHGLLGLFDCHIALPRGLLAFPTGLLFVLWARAGCRRALQGILRQRSPFGQDNGLGFATEVWRRLVGRAIALVGSLHVAATRGVKAGLGGAAAARLELPSQYRPVCQQALSGGEGIEEEKPWE